MKNQLIKTFLFIFVLTLLIFANTHTIYSNSAEPPSIIVIVPNAPKDLEINLFNKKLSRTDKGNESYFTVYSIQARVYTGVPESWKLQVSTGGNTFEVALDTKWKNYYNLFTLDLENQTLTTGKSLSRSITLISLRVILTLIIEGLLFFLFGFRRLKSWLIFLIVNLITQGLLNIWLNGNFYPLQGYIIFPLIGMEILVLIIEMLVFLVFVKEYDRWKTSFYVVFANFLSLVAGGFLITQLPI